MFLVMRGRCAARYLCAAACLVILAAVLWGVERAPDAAAAMAVERREARTVVIDAGHGGADGGAVAEDGTTEAVINLAVAQKLESLFALLGQETVMVRREDKSIHSAGVEGLREQKVSDIHNRVELVNAAGNAVLISIHQNSLPQVRTVHGAQVFFNDMAEAQALAETVQGALNQTVNPGNEKQTRRADASLYLMSHIDVPGILVECGFLSNAQETQLLKEDAYQQKLALTIAAGYLQHESTEDGGTGEEP